MNELDLIEDHFASHARQLVEDPAERLKALRACSFFQPVADDWLLRMSEMAQIRTFAPDTCIATQDDSVKAFHVILYGTAEAFRNGRLVGIIETGDCFGEGIFFGDGSITASATVIADGKMITAEFSPSVIEALNADPQAMVSMDKALLLALYKKLKGANQKIERLMQV